MPKTVAILCPGPSLPSYPGRYGLDAVIGVNRAVAAFECDYWVFADVSTSRETVPLGRPTLVCDRGVKQQLRQSALAEHPYIDREWAGPIANYPVRWCHFSATSALVLAFGLGATEIRCWGVDRSGLVDWDGVIPVGAVRTQERWQREATIWSQLVDQLAAAGVSVVLCGEESQEQAAVSDQSNAKRSTKKKR